jgi:hypothetical protein
MHPLEATRIAKAMLPEMLFYDPSRQACFPVNGRTLTDDAVDSFLTLLTMWLKTANPFLTTKRHLN